MDTRTRTSQLAAGVSLVVALALVALAVYSPLTALISVGPALIVAGLGRVADRQKKASEGLNLVLVAAGAGLIGVAVLVAAVLVRW